MPYRRNDSPVWWASYADPSGKRVRRSTETTNRREAQALESKWRLEAKQQRLWGTQPSRTFDELMLKYLESTEHVKRKCAICISAAPSLGNFLPMEQCAWCASGVIE